MAACKLAGLADAGYILDTSSWQRTHRMGKPILQ